MKAIGILYHPRRSDSSELALQVEELLAQHQADVWRGTSDDEATLEGVAAELDLLITLGGDGTIVRAIRSVACHGLPILGVNLGRLGFLAEVEPSRIREAFSALFDGDYRVEERMMQPVPGVPVHVCGEAYSHDQGWVEGALEVTERMLQTHLDLEPPTYLGRASTTPDPDA